MSNQNNNKGDNGLTNNILNNSQSRESDLLQQAAVLQHLLNQQQHLQQFQQQNQQQQQQQPNQQQQQQSRNTLLAQLSTQQQLQDSSSFLPNQQQQNQQNNNNNMFQVATNSFLQQQTHNGNMQHQIQQQRSRQRPFGGRADLNDRECFFLFIKILMKLATNNPRARSRAKAIISECTRRNRMGDPEFMPLQDAIELRLRGVIGELYWSRARLFFDAYCERNGIRANQRPSSLPAVAPV